MKKLISTRQGFRAHSIKMLQTLAELLNKVKPLNEDNLTTLKDLHEQFQRKEESISRLDMKMLKGITTMMTLSWRCYRQKKSIHQYQLQSYNLLMSQLLILSK